jgi:hypothetical protein
MIIAFNLSHLFNAGSADVSNARALRSLLECLTEINVQYLQEHPGFDLYQSGVRYGRTTLWETIPALVARGYGDCKSLTCALIAQYRVKGIQARPVFRFVKNQVGGRNFHILVQTMKGYEDPSRVLGMSDNENQWFVRR